MRPYPKAPERRETIRRRKNGQSQIQTNTPEKTWIVFENNERLKKKMR
jgi:hypothetical protein